MAKFLIFVLLICFITSSCSTSKGYNYKAHHAKSIKYKHNNEHGKYMKCKKH